MTLCQLIRKICNRLTSVVSSDVLGNLMESLHNLLMTREKDSELLLKCVQIPKHRHSILKESGFDLATNSLRGACVAELLSQEQCES